MFQGGGKGAETLANSPVVGKLLQAQDAAGRFVAAICAAPTALISHNIGKGKKVTSYPVFKEQMEKDFTYSEVSEIDSLITSFFITNEKLALINFDRTEAPVSFMSDCLIGHFEMVSYYACFQLVHNQIKSRNASVASTNF